MLSSHSRRRRAVAATLAAASLGFASVTPALGAETWRTGDRYVSRLDAHEEYRVGKLIDTYGKDYSEIIEYLASANNVSIPSSVSLREKVNSFIGDQTLSYRWSALSFDTSQYLNADPAAAGTAAADGTGLAKTVGDSTVTFFQDLLRTYGAGPLVYIKYLLPDELVPLASIDQGTATTSSQFYGKLQPLYALMGHLLAVMANSRISAINQIASNLGVDAGPALRYELAMDSANGLTVSGTTLSYTYLGTEDSAGDDAATPTTTATPQPSAPAGGSSVARQGLRVLGSS